MLTKPLTYEEYKKIKKGNFSGRLTASFPTNYEVISRLITDGFLKFEGDMLNVYDVGVGSGKGAIQLSQNLIEAGIEHCIHAVDKRRSQLSTVLGSNFIQKDLSKLNLLLGDITQRKLENLADLTIGLKVISSRDDIQTFSHIMFDNLIHGTKVGGYIITANIDPDENKYGIINNSFPGSVIFDNCNIQIYKKILEKKVFDFPIPSFERVE